MVQIHRPSVRCEPLPAKMLLSPLVAQTFGRLAGISALLELLGRSIPESKWAENEELKRKAEEEGWKYEDFDVERQILEERFSVSGYRGSRLILS